MFESIKRALLALLKPRKEEKEPAGKFDEECSVCGAAGTEKKWMGQYWHKKCLRAVKKGARKMI